MTDFSYYKKNFKGNVITDASLFEKYSKLALLHIKVAVNSDIKYKEDEIADCICALAEQLSRFEDTKNIKSESVDGYSVTYSDNLNKTLRETLKIYLPKELLYRGI